MGKYTLSGIETFQPGGAMQIDAVRDTMNVRMGATFGAPDVTRLDEAVAALGPFSRLTIDFGGVRQCDDAALARLASALVSFPKVEVTIRGLTTHQSRLLGYLGLDVHAS
jgi:hypothetical protein